jgi:branched-chain amino acid transport system permease protein
MTPALFVEQILNGVQFGVMLFLMSAGLTLVFGIMGLINLAHGSLYMAGAFMAAATLKYTGSFALAVLVAMPATALIGAFMETLVLRRFYERGHLDQVLVTFGLVLVMNDLTRLAFGVVPLPMPLPAALAGSVEVMPGLPYPVFRLAILGAGLTVAAALYFIVVHNRSGLARSCSRPAGRVGPGRWKPRPFASRLPFRTQRR